MSNYFQSLKPYLHGKGLLTDMIKNTLLEHDNQFHSTPSIRINFGKYKGKTVSEVAQFDKKDLNWLVRQTWCCASMM